MAKKLYKLVMIHGYTEAYYQLSKEEKERLWERVSANVDKAGARAVTPIYNSRWSNDKCSAFFIMEYPDVEAAIADIAGTEEFELFRYMVSETIFGVEDTAPQG